MKIFSLMLAAVLLTGFNRAPKTKIIFFGDSITEQGVKPGGYVSLLDSTFSKNALGNNYSIAGAGISGNKVYDLYLRMDDDVLAQNPGVVVIWIGVNDVWHKRSLGTGTDADKFERFYNAILKKLSARGIRAILCTPAVVGEKNDYTNELDGDLNKYSSIIRSIAQKNDCPVVDLRQQFHDYLRDHNPENKDRGILTTDGVHLNALGNQFVSARMFEVLQRVLPQGH